MSLTLQLPSGPQHQTGTGPSGFRLAVDAIIFDMDGLLIDSEGLSVEAWRATLASYGVTMTKADIDEMLGLRIDEDAALLIQRYALPTTIDDLACAKTEHMVALVRTHLKPMPGAVELLAWLDAHHIPRALATSGLSEYARECLVAVGLDDAFATRVTGDAVKRGKPAPDIFLLAAAQLNISPPRCLVLEDAPNGVAAAVAAQMPVIAIPNDHTLQLRFPPVTARAQSLFDVLTWLESADS
jgi:HAD superfamily hydrolase (TIGR01509 family)